jgi:thiosulfate/3-mercaptopyruvate sulfurtransferase
MNLLPVQERGYDRPELLVETGWLHERLGDGELRVIDARPEEAYGRGHIPGAVCMEGFTLGGVRKGTEMPDSEAFAALAGSLGIDNDTPVVVYDKTGPLAGMVAWAFMYYGHTDIRLLDGGLTKWMAEERALTTEVLNREPRWFSARLMEGLYCGLDQVKASIEKQGAVFWDTRTLDEFNGKSAPFNPPPRMGHIPGAVQLEWSELFDKETNTLRPAAECKERLSEKGITPESAVTTY